MSSQGRWGPATATTFGLNGMRGAGLAGEPDYKEGRWEGGPGHHCGGSMDIVGIDISKAKFDVSLLLGERISVPPAVSGTPV